MAAIEPPTSLTTALPTPRLAPARLTGLLARAAYRLGDVLAGLAARQSIARLERSARRADRAARLPGLGQLGLAARTGRPAWQQREH